MNRRILVLAAVLISVATGLWFLFSQLVAPPGAGPRLPPAVAMRFQKHLRSGLELGRLFQLTRAAEEFESCVRLDPGHAEARVHLGRTLLARNEPAAAMREFEEAIRLAPEHTGIQRFLYEIRSDFPGLANPQKARGHLDALRSACGDLIDFELRLRRLTVKTGSSDPYALAMEDLRGRRATLRSPEMKELHRAFFPEGEEHPAVRGDVLGVPGLPHFQTLFARFPGLIALREAVAVQLVNPSRFGLPPAEDGRIPGSTLPLELAQGIFEELLDFAPFYSIDSIYHFSGLALVDMKMGDYALAATRLEWTLENLRGEFREVFQRQNTFELAVSYYRLGKLDEARTLFREIVARDPSRVVAAWYLYLLGAEDRPWRTNRLPPGLASGFRFEDRAAALGIAKEDAGGTSSWIDYDSDGDLDVYVSGCDTYSILYRNDGGRFVDATKAAGLGQVRSGFCNVFADHDGDGDLDLFVGRDGWAGPDSNSLFENRGDGTFVDVTAPSGLDTGPRGSSFACAWSDFDHDGQLDVFITNGVASDGSANRLFRNRGDGTFEDATAAAGLEETPGIRTVGCAVGDYDQDGWADIFINGFATAPNRLYHNRGDGTFEEIAKQAGVDDSDNRASGFVALFADLDGDGLQDIFAVNWAGEFADVVRCQLPGYSPLPADLRDAPGYFRNRGDGTFEDLSAKAGFLFRHGSMGAGVADLNNDGFLDIYVGNGGPELERVDPDSLYVSHGGKRFVDIARSLGMGHVGKGHGVSFADYDRDGDLDIYVPLGGAFHGDMWKNAFYVNEAGNRGHWLQVFLRGTRSNLTGVGAQLTARAGGLVVLREKRCGVGFGSSDSPYLHFGLGGNTRVETLTVRWPSGQVDTLREVPVDRFIVVTEGSATWEDER